jgi:glycosyltransferase involved in cell wall biosynthesis
LLENEDIPFKVLVWDNGSQDDTLTLIKETHPEVVTCAGENNLGVAGGRNASAQVAINELGASTSRREIHIPENPRAGGGFRLNPMPNKSVERLWRFD